MNWTKTQADEAITALLILKNKRAELERMTSQIEGLVFDRIDQSPHDSRQIQFERISAVEKEIEALHKGLDCMADNLKVE